MHRRIEQRRKHSAALAKRKLRLCQRPDIANRLQRTLQLSLSHGQFEGLGEQDGPSHERRKREPAHHDLDQDVG